MDRLEKMEAQLDGVDAVWIDIAKTLMLTPVATQLTEHVVEFSEKLAKKFPQHNLDINVGKTYFENSLIEKKDAVNSLVDAVLAELGPFRRELRKKDFACFKKIGKKSKESLQKLLGVNADYLFYSTKTTQGTRKSIFEYLFTFLKDSEMYADRRGYFESGKWREHLRKTVDRLKRVYAECEAEELKENKQSLTDVLKKYFRLTAKEENVAVNETAIAELSERTAESAEKLVAAKKQAVDKLEQDAAEVGRTVQPGEREAVEKDFLREHAAELVKGLGAPNNKTKEQQMLETITSVFLDQALA